MHTSIPGVSAQALDDRAGRSRRAVLRHLRPDRRSAAALAVAVTLATVLPLAAPQLMRDLVDGAIAGEPTSWLIGLALGRYRFRGSGLMNLVMFAAISCAEIIMGASLLSMFVTLAVPLGFWTVVIAHVMFSVSFVAVTVRARVMTLDRSLEEAARDLGATGWETFRLVTLPMIFPGVLAGSLLAFALSIDDFVITNFTSGGTVTFPLWIWGSTRVGIPPQVNVMGTLIFAAGVLIAVLNAFGGRRRS